MEKEFRVLPEAVRLHFRAMVIEIVSLYLDLHGSLIGTLSGHCPVHQLAP